MRHQIGIDRLMWGADYPHYEGTWPHTDQWLKETFGGLPTSEVRAVLAANPAQVFGFDLDQLSKFADRIGPSVTELETYEPKGDLWRW